VVVFGVSANEYEQEVCAWIKLKSDPKSAEITILDIRKFCESELDTLKHPRFINFVNSQDYPVNKLGKYLLNEMAKIYKDKLHDLLNCEYVRFI
jgi:acyl-CoA synthetase (AMP-forming)/AMP-acid ligase II